VEANPESGKPQSFCFEELESGESGEVDRVVAFANIYGVTHRTYYYQGYLRNRFSGEVLMGMGKGDFQLTHMLPDQPGQQQVGDAFNHCIRHCGS